MFSLLLNELIFYFYLYVRCLYIHVGSIKSDWQKNLPSPLCFKGKCRLEAFHLMTGPQLDSVWYCHGLLANGPVGPTGQIHNCSFTYRCYRLFKKKKKKKERNRQIKLKRIVPLWEAWASIGSFRESRWPDACFLRGSYTFILPTWFEAKEWNNLGVVYVPS